MKTYYSEKIKGVHALVDLKKHITETDFINTAAACQLPVSSLKRAWETFQVSGGKFVDFRYKTAGNGKTFKLAPSVVCKNKKNKTITGAQAAKIILDYKNSKLNSREICNKYNISLGQFYSWIKELNVAGRLFGQKVLDPTKYYKLNVLDVIWYSKHPDTKRRSIRNRTVLEMKCFDKVSDVLERYLPKVK